MGHICMWVFFRNTKKFKKKKIVISKFIPNVKKILTYWFAIFYIIENWFLRKQKKK